MRSNTTQRNHRARIGIGACALLLPPLTLGAAFYSMLTTPDEGTARPAVAAAGAPAVGPELLRETIQPRAVGADPQPMAHLTRPAAGKPPPREGTSSVPTTGARQALVAGSVENTARVSERVPVRITMDPPATANPPAPANMDSVPTGSLGAERSQSAPAEVSTALLPRVLNPSPQLPPQIQPPRMSAAQMPAAQAPLAADPPSAEGALAPTASRPARPSNLANRSATLAVRRNAQPQRQHAFSLRNWLQQLGIVPRNTRG
jgi:hypothetical protein